MSFISDFMLISIQHVAVKFKSNGGRSQQTAMHVLSG